MRRNPYDAPAVAAEQPPSLADFGLAAPLTDVQAALLIRLAQRSHVYEAYGYAANPAETPSLQALARLWLVQSVRRGVGDPGPRCRTLTLWWASAKGRQLAIALVSGELQTAQIRALRPANDMGAAA